jgi:hypothetical protein
LSYLINAAFNERKSCQGHPREAGGHELPEDRALTGISFPTIHRLEHGLHRPSVDTALKLARWLGWTLEEVVEASR